MREQLTTTQSFPPAWMETEPPKDGTPICAIGRLIYRDDDGLTTVDPFFASILWEKDSSNYDGWHFHSNGMCVAQTLEDEVFIDHWFPIPFVAKGGAS